VVERFEVAREQAEEDYRGFVVSLVGIHAISEVPAPGTDLA
jgi:hypothetical protein